MKKFLILIIIIVLIIVGIILYKNNSSYAPTLLHTTANSNLSEETYLKNQNLKITLKGIYNKTESKDKVREMLTNVNFEESDIDKTLGYIDGKSNIIVELSTLDNSNLSEPTFDYLIYDKDNNILSTSIVYVKGNTELNNFIKYFTKEKYNSSNIEEFKNHQKNYSKDIRVLSNNSNSLLMAISLDIPDENLDLSDAHLLIVNPGYKTEKDNQRVSLNNTIFDYNIQK